MSLFGGTSTPAAAPSPAFANAQTTAPAPAFGTATTATQVSTEVQNLGSNNHNASVEIPPYDEVFPFISIHSSIRGHLSRLASLSPSSSTSTAFDSLIGQQLIAYISTSNTSSTNNKSNGQEPVGNILLHCNPLLDLPSASTSKQKIMSPPDPSLRQQLQSNPYIKLQGKLTRTTPQILNEIFSLADDLQISEISAIALYAEASNPRTRKWLEDRIPQLFVDTASIPAQTSQYQSSNSESNQNFSKAAKLSGIRKHYSTVPLDLGNDVPKAARELFFHERSCLLSSLLLLIKERIAAVSQLEYLSNTTNCYTNAVIHATDELLSNKLIPNLITCIQNLTSYANSKAHDMNQLRESQNASTTFGGNTAPANFTSTLAFGQTSASSTFMSPSTSTATSSYQQAKHKETSHMVLMSFALSQRQRAVECLFYVLYQTQILGEELVSLLGCVKELSNGDLLCPLDPMKDVPPIYIDQKKNQDQQQLYQNSQTTFGRMQNEIRHGFSSTSGGTFQEKHVLDWENELIQELWRQGKPQLMQCVSVLSLTILCALDSSQVLLDRNIHGPNSFGVGNALLPPSHSGLCACDELDEVQALLDIHTSNSTWNRKDVLGLFCAAYALLIQPKSSTNTSNDSFFSPGAHTTNTTSLLDIKKTFHSCLHIASSYKAFSFARICVLPSIGQITQQLTRFESYTAVSTSLSHAHDEVLTNFEFYSRVLADFTSSYLETIADFGEMPISREKWRIEEEEQLQLRRLHEEQRIQFGFQPNASMEDNKDRQIDYTKRPDCMDDLIALAVEVCSSCPTCAARFWNTDEGLLDSETMEDEAIISIRLHPSSALIKMENLQKEDDSLLPAYLSFLAALSLAGTDGSADFEKNGANIVHSILAQDSFHKGTVQLSTVTWAYLLNAVQWYADQLSSPRSDSRTSSSSSYSNNHISSSSAYDSTSYYYGMNEDFNMPDNSTFMHTTTPQQNNHKEKSTNSDLKNSTKRTLGESNTLALLSVLALISRIATSSDDAQKYIISLRIPSTVGGNREEDCLTILFQLLNTSLSSDIKGEVFNALAALVRNDKAVASRAWNLLEASQVLPTSILEQYTTGQNLSGTAPSTMIHNFSSSRHVSLNSKGIPKDEQYGILYEMVYVEALVGSYPSTEGFLFFLNALILSAGIKPNLGSGFRRPGISPYIEYIVSFILPRTVSMPDTNLSSMSKCEQLPFATCADRSRLLTRAFEVMSTVISNYVIPPPFDRNTESQRQNPTLEEVRAHHNKLLRKENSILICRDDILNLSIEKDINFEDIESSIRDFREELIDIPVTFPNQYFATEKQAVGTRTSTVPRPKSPGFTLLSDILGGGLILKYLLLILVENSGCYGIHSLGEESRAKMQALTLFLDSKPSFNDIKKLFQNKSYSPSKYQPPFTITSYSLVPPTLNQLDVDHSDRYDLFCSPNDAILWREQTIALSLRILCLVASREELFSRSVNASSTPLTNGPKISFDLSRKFSTQRNNYHMHPVNVSRISNTLIAAAGSFPFNAASGLEPLPMIGQYVGYHSHENEIAERAVGIISYVARSVSPNIGIPALCGKLSDGPHRLARAFAQKLLHSDNSLKNEAFNRNDACVDEEYIGAHKKGIRGVILDMLLSNLTSMSPNISQILLGLSSSSEKSGTQKQQGSSNISSDCLDAILHLLSDESFLLHPESTTLAARSFELIYRLYSFKNTCAKTMLRLREKNFWVTQCNKYFSKTELYNRDVSIIEIVCDPGEETSLRLRNNCVMHAFAWLIKCVALELHSLMGDDFSETSLEENIWPKPTQCRKLLEVLIGSSMSQSMISRIMECLPLSGMDMDTKTSLIANRNTMSRDIIKATKRTHAGPVEVFGKYEVIDLVTLSEMMQNTTYEKKVEVIEWARNWNSYIAFICSSSHIATAWGFLVSTIAMSCDSIIVRGYGVEGTNIEKHHSFSRNGVMNLIISILQRLNTNTSLFPDSNRSKHVKSPSDIKLGVALPLSMSVLHLVQLFIEFDSYHSTIENNMTEISNMCVLIASCISSCSKADPSHNERAVILSSALVALFTWMKKNGGNEFFCASRTVPWKEILLETAIYLSHLAVNDRMHYDSQNPSYKTNAIALAAREGLSSIISFFEKRTVSHSALQSQHDGDNSPNYFLLHLFEGRDGELRLSSLIGLIQTLEADIAWTLLSIAQCNYGTELLFHAGLPSTLLNAANNSQESKSEHSPILPERELYGSVEMNPPSFLFGHIALLSTMITAQKDNRRLAAEGAKFIRHHLTTFDCLLRSFPRHADLTEEFLRLLCLTTSVLQDDCIFGQQSNTKNLIESAFDTDLPLVERRVEDFVFHIASFPFPDKLLPPFPTKLIQFEQSNIKNRQENFVQVGVSWWDRIPKSDNQSTTPLRNPPFSTNSHDYGDTLFGTVEHTSEQTWSEEKYEFAIKAVSSLDDALIFLKNRLKASDANTIINLDGILLAKGIFRCVNTANAINEHLSSHMTNGDDGMNNNKASSQHLRQIEKDALIVLGPILGRCAQRLLIIASLYLNSLTKYSRFTSGVQSVKLNKDAFCTFSSAMQIILEHLNVEQRGIGCLKNQDGAKRLTRTLREQINKIQIQ